MPKYRRVEQDEIELGVPLPKSLYDRNGTLLIKEGGVIETEHHLRNLLEKEVFFSIDEDSNNKEAVSNSITFKVIFTGIRSDIPSADSRIKLATLFKTTPEQIDKLIASSSYVLKKSLTEEIAAKYKAAIEAAGGYCRIESEKLLEAKDDLVAPPHAATPRISSGSATHAQQVRQIAPNEVLIYFPIEIAFAHASAVIEQLGTIKHIDRTQQVIEGRIRYGLRSVGVRISLVENNPNETTVVIQCSSDDASSAGANSATKRLIETLINLDNPGYKPDRLGMRPSVLIGALLLLAVIIAVAMKFMVPSIYETSGATQANSLQTVTAGPKTLYRFWQSKYVPEPGAYEDELVGGELLYECKVGGKYPAYFGYLIIRQTFMITPNPNAKPFAVYIAGIDYGDRLRFITQPPETGGKGAIESLQAQGCEISPGLEAKASAAIPQSIAVK